MRRRWIVLFAVGPCAMARWSVARAETRDATVVRVTYVSDACPSQRAFDSALRERVRGGLRAPRADEPARDLVVELQGHGKRIAGRLELREPDGATTERNVDGESCEAVASGLALVAALALEGDSSASATPNPTDPPDGGGVPATATAPDNAPEGSSKKRAARAPEEATRDAGASTTAARWEVSLGVGLGAVLGAAPRPLLVVPPFVEVAHVGGSGSVFAVRARLLRGSVGASGAEPSASFTWTAGDLDTCPIAWSFESLRLSPCVRVEVGSLEAQGAGVTPALDETRLWLGLGAAGRLRWTPIAPLFFEAEASLFAPLLRDRFYVVPDATVFRAPVLAGGAALDLGVAF